MTTYRTVEVDGIEIFYREAGPAYAPAILLLHGFPSSSRMWEPLLTRLGNAFHLVAPDYPGFGHSDTPDPAGFAYTFDHLAEVVDGFTGKLGLTRYVLFLQDYGGPIGFRLALAHPDRVQALIVQNAVAHEDGLGPLWEARRQFWAHRSEHETALRENFFSPAATRLRHVGTSPRPENYDPDAWTDELAFLRRPGQADIQADLFFDYQTNVASYPAWQRVASGSPTAPASDLGSLRPVLRGCGGRSLQTRRARRRGTPARRRPLRPRRASRPHRRSHARFPRCRARQLSRGNPHVLIKPLEQTFR